MKKILIGISLAIIVLVVFLNIGGKEKTNISDDVVYQNTINISRTYVALRIKTDKILKEAVEYPDYNTWNNEMTELIKNWEKLELKADKLEKQANLLSKDKLSFKLINKAHAYSKDEISNVFDKAPAGRKIRTLAKYLGVDAKRAYKILQNDQEFVKADAWNEAGDTFKKLEVSAIVIKDGCKVAGFVGGVIITGGATGLAGGVTIGKATVLLVTGTDLMLEVGEDTATIALGDKHKATKYISGIREYTDPAASILSLTDIPGNIKKGADLLDKVGVILTQVDQVRSMLQDGKLLGINISPDSKIEIASIEEDEVEEWIDEHKVELETEEAVETGEGGESEEGYLDDLEEWLEGFEDLDDWLDDFDEEEELTTEEEEVEIPVEEDVDIGEGGESEEIKAENNKEEDDDVKVMEDSTVSDYAAKMMKMMNDGLLTEAEWQESLETVKEMIRQKNEEEEAVEEDIDSEMSSADMVDKYMKEMQGQAMNEYSTIVSYAKKFSKMQEEGLISEDERNKLIEEAQRLSDGQSQVVQEIEDQETELLAENEEKRAQIASERGDIIKMTTKEFIEDTEIYSAKNDARKVWLKAECDRIFEDEERSESCYYTGK